MNRNIEQDIFARCLDVQALKEDFDCRVEVVETILSILEGLSEDPPVLLQNGVLTLRSFCIRNSEGTRKLYLWVGKRSCERERVCSFISAPPSGVSHG